MNSLTAIIPSDLKPISITTYLSSIDSNDIYSELSLLLNAELDDFVLNDINSAVDNYLKFMDNFQHSVFYEEIRLRLERIIG